MSSTNITKRALSARVGIGGFLRRRTKGLIDEIKALKTKGLISEIKATECFSLRNNEVESYSRSFSLKRKGNAKKVVETESSNCYSHHILHVDIYRLAGGDQGDADSVVMY